MLALEGDQTIRSSTQLVARARGVDALEDHLEIPPVRLTVFRLEKGLEGVLGTPFTDDLLRCQADQRSVVDAAPAGLGPQTFEA